MDSLSFLACSFSAAEGSFAHFRQQSKQGGRGYITTHVCVDPG